MAPYKLAQNVPPSVWDSPYFTEVTLGCTDVAPELKPLVPVPDPDYVFNPHALRKIRTFWHYEAHEGIGRKDNSPREATVLIGPVGSGKTSLVRQVAALIGMPLVEVNVNVSTKVMHLIQTTKVEEGSTKKQDGPLTRAARNGCWFLVNEANMMHPDELALLNDMIESGRFTVTDTGEVITCQRGFMFFATINPSASMLGVSAAGASLNVGTKEISSAIKRRANAIVVDYPSEAEEAAIIVKRTGINPVDAGRCVNVAKAMRAAKFAMPFSTSMAVRFARKYATYTAAVRAKPKLAELIPAPAIEAIDEVLADWLTPEQGMAARNLVTATFGK